jgi:hypothetical protein
VWSKLLKKEKEEVVMRNVKVLLVYDLGEYNVEDAQALIQSKDILGETVFQSDAVIQDCEILGATFEDDGLMISQHGFSDAGKPVLLRHRYHTEGEL